MADFEKLSDETMEKVAGGQISQDEALARALAQAGVTRDQVQFIKKVQPDFEHGRMVYEIEFYQGGFEYSFDVDAENGAILKFEKDYD